MDLVECSSSWEDDCPPITRLIDLHGHYCFTKGGH
jgi:hypothetical protein